MSREHRGDMQVEVVETLYRLFGEGRVEDTFELMDPGVILNEPGDPELLPWAGEFRGLDGLRRFYEGLGSGLSSIEIDPDSLQLLPVGEDKVLAMGTERGTAAATGRAYVTKSAWIWTVRHGRIHGLQAFHDTAAMERALRT